MITTIIELTKCLQEAGKAADGHEALFRKIAEALFNNFAIEKNGLEYRFAEIEFYHNKAYEPTSSNKHTYSRTTKAGEWLFHNSGMDLCFETNDGNYGGILIRSIYNGEEFIEGPIRVIDALFKQFDALKPISEIAHIQESKSNVIIEPVAFYRFNYDDKDIIEHPKYRYVLPESIWTKEKSKIKYTNKNGKVGYLSYTAYPYKK